MFPFSTIKRYIAKRGEYKGCIKFLKCPLCGKKFWGRLPTATHVAAFSAHCPRKNCGASVDERCIIESRRQKVARWSKAIAAAGWAVVKYPVQPFAATKKIVALETRVVEEVARIEDKVEKQGQMIVQRLNIQDNVLTGIGGLIASIKGESQAFIPTSAPMVPCPLDNLLPSTIYKFDYDRGYYNSGGRELTSKIIGHCTFYDTEVYDNYSEMQFFRTMCSKSSSEAFFNGDYCLASEGQIAFCKRMTFNMHASAELSKADAYNLMNSANLRLEVLGEIKLICTLRDIYEGRAHVMGVVIPGGRSIRFSCYIDRRNVVEMKHPIKFRIGVECVVGLLI